MTEYIDDETGEILDIDEKVVDDISYEPTNLSQYTLLCYLTSCPEVWSLAEPLLLPEYFDSEFKQVVEFCLEHKNEFKKLPSKLMIRGKTGVLLETAEDCHEPMVQEWLIKETESYCRQKALYMAITNGAMKYADGDSKQTAAELEVEIKKVLTMSIRKNLGIEVHTNMKEALIYNKDNSGISCGLKHADLLLDGGFSKSSLNIFALASGQGKSVILTNMAYNYARIHKYNVIYISLELKQEKIQKRFATIMTGISMSNVYQQMDTIDKELRMRMIGSNPREGYIYVKHMPMNGTTCADIDAYIKHLMIQTGLEFQVLIIDYLDLLSPKTAGIKSDNIHLKDKFVSEELHGLIDEYNMIGFSASQRVKGAEENMENETQGSVSGGVSKTQTADNLIIGKRGLKEKEEGLMKWSFRKSRDSAADGKSIYVTFDDNTLIIGDAPEDIAYINNNIQTNKKQTYTSKSSVNINSNNTTAGKLREGILQDSINRH